MPVTDPRFLAATTEDMLLDLWTAHYAKRAQDGEGVTEFEDDGYSPDAIEQALAARSASDEDWEDVP